MCKASGYSKTLVQFSFVLIFVLIIIRLLLSIFLTVKNIFILNVNEYLRRSCGHHTVFHIQLLAWSMFHLFCFPLIRIVNTSSFAVHQYHNHQDYYIQDDDDDHHQHHHHYLCHYSHHDHHHYHSIDYDNLATNIKNTAGINRVRGSTVLLITLSNMPRPK